ncbi:cohesin complex subunit psm1 [Flagelloscypha sp. PMI_526]|nr:cohesin complex subunit psm1 [Flagelloscypha sp. PMI_526]
MPLHSLELHNFKSYRGTQTIGPFTSFSSIIGPNGAGKSNLMDAISFVLGVKSKQLRSAQLKDLVYRGRREPRKSNFPGDAPLPPSSDNEDVDDGMEERGANDATSAWVCAIFHEPQEAGRHVEWRFKRGITTKDGVSKYEIDSKTVSYGEYVEALKKFQILVKANNFLVFQGDVEAIAAQSSGTLAGLIDRISGSEELKKDYEDKKKKLDDTAEKAQEEFGKRRVVAGEIKSYKEQKTEVEKYEKLVDERNELARRRVLLRLYHLEESLETTAHQIRTTGNEVINLKRELSTAETALDSKRSAQADLRAKISTLERKMKGVEKKADGRAREVVGVQTQIEHTERKAGNFKKTEEDLVRQEQETSNKLASLRKTLEETEATREEAARKIAESSTNRIRLSDVQLGQLRELKSKAALQRVSERQQLESLQRDEKVLKRSLNTLVEKRDGLNAKHESLKTELEAAKTHLEEVSEKFNDLTQQLAEERKELKGTEDERVRIGQLTATVTTRLEKVHEELVRMGQNKVESQRELRKKENLEALMKRFEGVKGRISTLCRPSARKYELAVATVLGRNLDAIVVESEKVGIECVKYLSTQHLGIETFIPLDTIQTKGINDKMRQFSNRGARLALDLIEFDPSLERAFNHACGTALICDSMDVARFVCWDRGVEVKAVTLDGTVIHKSGLITGGRSSEQRTGFGSGPSNGTTWSERDINTLIKSRDNLTSDLRELGKQRLSLKNEQVIKDKIDSLESRLNVARDDLSAAKRRVTGLKDEAKHIDGELKTLRPELSKNESAHGQLEAQIEKIQGIIDKDEHKIFGAFCRQIGVANIREYELGEGRLAQEESEARVRFDGQASRLGHQIAFEQSTLESIQERLGKLRDSLTTAHNNLKKLQKQVADLKAQENELNETHQNHSSDLDQLKSSLAIATSELESAKKTVKDKARSVDGKVKEIGVWNDERAKWGLERSGIYRRCRLDGMQLPLANDSAGIESVAMEENLRDDVAMDVDETDEDLAKPKEIDDYGIEVDFDELDEDEKEDTMGEMAAKLEADMNKISAEIDKMAPNMKAVDRLDEVEGKLAATEKDAEKARTGAKNAKDEFQRVKKKRVDLFNKAYNHIADRIDSVYKDLTKGKASPMGGVAYLSVEDPDEPYAAGIKYHAMPPMKRFRDMEQLSGGEKTVAALALLFAIHSFHPSPFFVLDEVDAALDNVNVSRVANYIRSRASPDFQFIVISLKSSFYEKAESLVGVFRDQEIGSSKGVTLDLTQFDD